jgi:hypothetical protein
MGTPALPHPAANRFVQEAFLIGFAKRKALSIWDDPLAWTCIIAQTIEAQGNKKSFAVVMQVNYAGSRGQSSRSSTTFRTTRVPLPEIVGSGSFRLGSAATVRLARLTSGLALVACNQSSTRFTARLTWDWVFVF